MKITENEYIEAQKIVDNYIKQEKEYRLSVKKNIDNKIYEFGKYKPEDTLWDVDISVRLHNALQFLGVKNDNNLFEISKKVSERDLSRLSNTGKKTVNELIKLLNSAGLKLKI
jgi:DNA-directed RNA polymerase alpha subunit